jgi:hypothetical protein
MIPPDYASFFSTMAAVGATLFGLIFVAISIAPDSITSSNAPLDRNVRATTSYLALLNPLVISLFALIPHQQIGFVAIGMGTLGLLNTLGMLLALIRSVGPSIARLRHSFFALAGFFLYGYECYFAIRLIRSPDDNVALYFLANLLILSSIFGVIRAWELIGIQRFYLINWLSSIGRRQKPVNPDRQDSVGLPATGKKEKTP